MRLNGGADSAPAGGSRTLISGGLGSHCPAQLRGSVRQRAGEAEERRGEKSCRIKELSDCGSFRLQKAVPRSKEKRRSGAPRGERPASLGVRRKALKCLPAPFGAPLPSRL